VLDRDEIVSPTLDGIPAVASCEALAQVVRLLERFLGLPFARSGSESDEQ
jgi:hypothetical protein